MASAVAEAETKKVSKSTVTFVADLIPSPAVGTLQTAPQGRVIVEGYGHEWAARAKMKELAASWRKGRPSKEAELVVRFAQVKVETGERAWAAIFTVGEDGSLTQVAREPRKGGAPKPKPTKRERKPSIVQRIVDARPWFKVAPDLHEYTITRPIIGDKRKTMTKLTDDLLHLGCTIMRQMHTYDSAPGRDSNRGFVAAVLVRTKYVRTELDAKLAELQIGKIEDQQVAAASA